MSVKNRGFNLILWEKQFLPLCVLEDCISNWYFKLQEHMKYETSRRTTCVLALPYIQVHSLRPRMDQTPKKRFFLKIGLSHNFLTKLKLNLLVHNLYNQIPKYVF